MRALVAVLAVAVGMSCGPESSDPPEASSAGSGAAAEPSGTEAAGTALADTAAARLFAGVLDSIAPDGGWERTRYIAFDRISSSGVRRSHRWDRFEGTYRLRAPVADGEMIALFDVDAPTEGERVWLDGAEVTDGERSDSLARRAHAWFINDTYWLLFPFKWDDPGVSVRYLGEVEEWGETWEAVELTFEEVGLTPQNRYRAFVDPETGMFELWQYYRDAADDEPGFTNRWTDWRRYGPILLSSRREAEDGSRGVYFESLEASTEVPPGAFDAP